MPTPPRDATFAARIDALLKLRKLSLNQLGERAGIGGGPMSRLRTRGPLGATMETMLKVADAAGVHVRWLADGTGPMEKDAIFASGNERRRAASVLAEEAGVAKEAIETVLNAPIQPEDERRSTLWWADKMRYTAIALLSGAPLPRDEKATPAAGTLRVPLPEPPTSSKRRPRSGSR